MFLNVYEVLRWGPHKERQPLGGQIGTIHLNLPMGRKEGHNPVLVSNVYTFPIQSLSVILDQSELE